MEPIADGEPIEEAKDRTCLTCLFYGKISEECAVTRAEKQPDDSCSFWADRDANS